MNYYTSTIPLPLAEKLKKKGMPLMTSVSISIVENKPVVDENEEQWYRPTYAEVFDWLMAKGIHIRIESDWDTETQIVTKLACDFNVEKVGMRPFYVDRPTWHEAAEAAIEMALTLI